MGGTFDVRVLSTAEGELAYVEVVLPRNPDWHGFRFYCVPESLTRLLMAEREARP